MPPERIPETELLSELQRLNEELGKTPSEDDMNDQGKYSSWPYHQRFGSWNEAIRAAGFKPHTTPQERSEEELVAELQRLAKQIDGKPSESDMQKQGSYSKRTYQLEFGSWNQALIAAGFEPRKNGTKISENELCNALQQVSDMVNGRPSTGDMRENGPFSPGTYVRRFGSWEEALDAAGLDP